MKALNDVQTDTDNLQQKLNDLEKEHASLILKIEQQSKLLAADKSKTSTSSSSISKGVSSSYVAPIVNQRLSVAASGGNSSTYVAAAAAHSNYDYNAPVDNSYAAN